MGGVSFGAAELLVWIAIGIVGLVVVALVAAYIGTSRWH